MVKALIVLNTTRNMKAYIGKIRFMKYGMWEGLNFLPMTSKERSIHTIEAPYDCVTCGKAFIVPFKLILMCVKTY